MTKNITENSGVVIRWGVIAGAVLALSIWFNTRLSSVEIAEAEQKAKVDLILDIVKDIRADIKKP
jgi:hypothetical protein